ncbi:MAG: hypothetical protein R8J85_09465 [Mariprofundales bacterium]
MVDWLRQSSINASDGCCYSSGMLIVPSSSREYRAARLIFWLLMVTMVTLIYRTVWLEALSDAVAIGDGWVRQISARFSPVEPLPEINHAPHNTLHLPASALPPDSPQTVGDLIADIQQQGDMP